jgi:pimeloyl-ACP methyl ester carboxylesterase
MHIRSLLALAWLGVSVGACSSDGGKEPADLPTTKIDRSDMTDVGTAPLDYTDRNLWVCAPGNDPDECTRNLDTTVFLPDGTSRVEKHVVAKDPQFDCFYVYPTVDLTGTANTTNFSDISHVLDALMSQGARFSKLCRVFAPLYRQTALGSSGTAVGLKGDAQLAISDVEDAFDAYMEHFNGGRKFVLIGHSQGTLMLQALYRSRFESDEGLRAQLISALLIGGGPTVPLGQKVGGSFQTLPACSAPGETGCVVAYNSYAKEAPPPENTAFGKAPEGQEVICTPPGMLSKNPGRTRMSYQPKTFATPTFVPNTPAGTFPQFDTPFVGFPEVFRGECVSSNGVHYLEISLDPPAGDRRAVAPYRNTLTEGVGFGLHVAEINLFLDDLIEAVRLQAETALAK